ncbi:hypothetical protein [Bermanella sp. R86510]|uniref:hypothetical protein n=1 Tax=unclassified Bermanella TaxID=2627862 RepID=UPI0037C57BD3
MTPSIDPNFGNPRASQIADTYDWQALANGHPACQQIRGKLADSIRFLSRFIGYESVNGDAEGARTLIKALLMLESVDESVSQGLINRTQEMLNYLDDYRSLLYETEADAHLCLQFDQLVTIFHGLLELRRQAHSGLMCSFGQLTHYLQQAS